MRSGFGSSLRAGVLKNKSIKAKKRRENARIIQRRTALSGQMRCIPIFIPVKIMKTRMIIRYPSLWIRILLRAILSEQCYIKINHREGHYDTVKPVKKAAVPRHNTARILEPDASFEHRFNQIAKCPCH